MVPSLTRPSSAWARSSAAASMSAMMTWPPWSMNARTVSMPMPPAPPVTTMRLPVKAEDMVSGHQGRIIQGCHDLRAAHVAWFGRHVVGDGVVDGAYVVPYQHVTHRPMVGVEEVRAFLMAEEVVQDDAAFLAVHPVNPHGVARVGIQHLPSGEWMHADQGLRHRWFLALLLLGECRAPRAGTLAHHIPEFFEVVGCGAPFQP